MVYSTVIKVLIILSLTWLSYQLAKKYKNLFPESLDPKVRELLSGLFQKLIIVAGILTAISTSGVDISAMVASLGLTSFVLGLALKDLLSNLMSGIMISLHSPFKVGDSLEIASKSGTVKKINLRYTVLENKDKNIYLIPNSKVFAEIVMIKNSSN
jgi:small-conductance mechanosensitive channel